MKDQIDLFFRSNGRDSVSSSFFPCHMNSPSSLFPISQCDCDLTSSISPFLTNSPSISYFLPVLPFCPSKEHQWPHVPSPILPFWQSKIKEGQYIFTSLYPFRYLYMEILKKDGNAVHSPHLELNRSGLQPASHLWIKRRTRTGAYA